MAIAPARNRVIADALVEKIRTIWGPTAPDGVERTYLPDVYSPDDLEALAGRQVKVSMIGESQIEKKTRDLTMREYRYLVLVVEKCDDSGHPPTAWVDERNDFVADLMSQLSDENEDSMLGNSDYPDTADWLTPADDGVLRECKLFWSYFEVAIREAA